jgi:hypothetical protein
VFGEMVSMCGLLSVITETFEADRLLSLELGFREVL